MATAPTAPAPPVIRAFVGATGKRYRIDGVSGASGAVRLVCGREERFVASEQLLATAKREGWTAVAELPGGAK
jgi:hypothetical protein